MILTLALRSLLAHPVRSVVLGIGFGLGVAVMAILLGVGEVVLEQAQAPALAGGGSVIVRGSAGDVTSARFILGSVLKGRGGPATAASPRMNESVFLVRPNGVFPVRARGGIPSLERSVADPETAHLAEWVDQPPDRAWSDPDPGSVLRAMDRFHPIPDVPARANDWAEWLYFKGHTPSAQFYLTFLVGPRRPGGRRIAGVRLQLDQGGRVTSYADSEEIDEARLLAQAPDLTIARNAVRLDGLRYRLTIDLPRSPAAGTAVEQGRAVGEIVVDAVAGRSLPPLAIRGAGGWLSGYVAPVMSGTLGGTIVADGAPVSLEGGSAYHDHNWGFWRGVSWRWGQVQHGDLSFLYGRVYPPADAADADRIPGFIAALGPDGPVGFSTRVRIDETNDPATGRPATIVVRGQSASLDLTMELRIEDLMVTGGAFGGDLDFLQLRARYRVTGRAGGRTIDFTAPGAAETFRGR
jgi:hypothetical protein